MTGSLPVGRHALGILLLLLAGTGCAERFDATELGVPVVMGAEAGKPVEGDPFQVKATSVHAMWGIFTLAQASMPKALSGQLLGGKSVANVKITLKSRFSDLLITVLTAGLIVPRTVVFEGVVVDQPPPR